MAAPMTDTALTTPVPPGFYREEKEVDPDSPWSMGAKLAIVAGIVCIAGTAGILSVTRPFNDESEFSCFKDVAKSDIVWVLDQSGSVGLDNYNLLKRSIESLSANFSVSQTSTRFGAVEFSTGSPTEISPFSIAINLDESSNFDEWSSNIDRLIWRSGGTNVASAFRYLEEVYFQDPANLRDDLLSRIVIFVGDGIPSLPACYNSSTFPGGGNLCPSHPDCEWAAEGKDANGFECVNHWFPSFPTRSAREALESLRRNVSFNFVYLAIENEAGQTVSDVFGDFENNTFGLYQPNDQVFVTSFENLEEDFATRFNLDCSVTVET